MAIKVSKLVVAPLLLCLCDAARLASGQDSTPARDCAREMRKAFESLQAWRRLNNGEYPVYFGDAVLAGFLPAATAVCPAVRKEKESADAKHPLASSRHPGGDPPGVYEYELAPYPKSETEARWLPIGTRSYTRRDVKLEILRRPFAQQVAMVRCYSHRAEAPSEFTSSEVVVLNLALGGFYYWSGTYWETRWLSDVPYCARDAIVLFGLRGPPFSVETPSALREALDISVWSSAFGDHPWWWNLPLFDEPPNSHATPHLRRLFEERHGRAVRVGQRNWWLNGVIQLQGKLSRSEQVDYNQSSVHGFPWERTGLPVNRKFRKAEWLQGTVWVGSPGEAAGWLVWRYESGATERVPIVYGRATARFWGDQAQVDGESGFPEPEWSHFESAAEVGRDRWLRLYVQTWENPRPNEMVATLDFVSNRESPASPFIIAINTYP